MTDILDNAASDSSENEDINRLFPRYKPKIPNDYNLNRVTTTTTTTATTKHTVRDSPPPHFQSETNANELECQTNGISENVTVNENDILSVHSNSEPQSQEHGAYEEDHSVVSAYGMFGINCTSYEDEGDGCQVDGNPGNGSCFNTSGFQEFKLRESRIEIAGGREVFSSNRIRYSRKRFTDEMLCCQSKNAEDGDGSKCEGNGAVCQEKRILRRSAVENEDKPTVSKTSAVIHPCTQKTKWDELDSIPQDLSNSNEIGNEPMVYETHVDGSEVIFDDIGYWKSQPGNLDVGLDAECISIFQQRMEALGKPLTLSTEVLNSEDDDETSSSHSPVKKMTPDKTVRDAPEGFEEEEIVVDDEMSKDDDESQGSTRTVHRKFIALIGNVPIAEYEGSPRRYGPRPGHPERVVANDEKVSYQGDREDVLKLACRLSEAADDKGKFEVKYDVRLLSDESQKPKAEMHCDPEYGGAAKNKLEYSTSSNSSSYVGRRLAHFQGCVSDDGSLKTLTDQFLHPSLLRECYGKNMDTDDAVYLSEMMEVGATALQEKNAFLDEDHDTISTNPDTEDLGETEMGEQVGQSRNFTLSPETTDCDSNDVESEVSYENEESVHSGSHALGSMPVLEDGLSSGQESEVDDGDGDNEAAGDRRRHHSADNPTTLLIKKQISEIEKEIARRSSKKLPVQLECEDLKELLCQVNEQQRHCTADDGLDFLDPLNEALNQVACSNSSTCLSGVAHSTFHKCDEGPGVKKESVDEAIKEIREAILNVKAIPLNQPPADKAVENEVPVWLPRPLYNQQKISEDGENKGQKLEDAPEEECDTDQETDQLLGKQRMDDKGFYDDKDKENKDQKKGRSKEVLIHEPAVLIEGVLFRARYLGSTQLVCEGQPTKATRMMQAEEAVSRIKAPEGENQPSTEVDLFISTEKIMVLNTDLKEIMMDHSLRTISYIADIGDLVVLMARRRMMSCQEDQEPKIRRTPKMICHVFESEEAQFIAQSIGQAFQVAYMEFLKANGIEDHSFVKEMDYQEVLNSQEIYGDELEMFAKKEMQKEVIVPKARGEMLGVVIVESGWGSMLPTVVIANLSPSGAAARCGQLNIGDQIIAINGISLVGLPLSTCQNYIKNAKTQMVVKLTVVPCAPVVEVKIKRPDTKYQLGFSVQNGVICSLLRGGIAERGGVRVGHRIIEINGQSVVAVPHERIVSLLATSVGEILMKTMPTSMFRLLTGQETPVYI